LVYQSDFVNALTGDALLAEFENNENPQLMQALEDYSKHQDYLRLKRAVQEVSDQLEQNIQKEVSDTNSDAN